MMSLLPRIPSVTLTEDAAKNLPKILSVVAMFYEEPDSKAERPAHHYVVALQADEVRMVPAEDGSLTEGYRVIPVEIYIDSSLSMPDFVKKLMETFGQIVLAFTETVEEESAFLLQLSKAAAQMEEYKGKTGLENYVRLSVVLAKAGETMQEAHRKALERVDG